MLTMTAVQKQQSHTQIQSQETTERESSPRGKEKRHSRSRRKKQVADMPVEDASYKVLLLGDSGVGKTALIRRLTSSEFKTNHLTTVGIDFVKERFDADGALVELKIWDTAGQEKFRSITKFQYRNTKGLLLVYDVTDRLSFETLGYWLESIDRELDQDNKEPVPVFIVGNKTDLTEFRVVSTEEGRKAADNHYVHGFIETSAKDGENVAQAFNQLANAITEVFNPELMNLYLDTDGKNVRDQKRIPPKKEKRRSGLRKKIKKIKLSSHIEVDEVESRKNKSCCTG